MDAFRAIEINHDCVKEEDWNSILGHSIVDRKNN